MPFTKVKRWNDDEQRHCLRLFHFLLHSGYHINDAVPRVQLQHAVKWHDVFRTMDMRLQSGESVARAFSALPIPRDLTHLLAFSVTHASLVNMLETMDHWLTLRMRTKQIIQTSIAYPLFLIVLLGILLVGYRFIIFPQLLGMFSGQTLPVVMKWLVWLVEATPYALLLLLIFGGIGLLFTLRAWRRKEPIDQLVWLARIPFFGEWIRYHFSLTYAYTLGCMLQCG
ncbi:MAG: type II secretion system F family protein, partial [Bacilli bacterium]